MMKKIISCNFNRRVEIVFHRNILAAMISWNLSDVYQNVVFVCLFLCHLARIMPGRCSQILILYCLAMVNLSWPNFLETNGGVVQESLVVTQITVLR
jgi:hypothetical protein